MPRASGPDPAHRRRGPGHRGRARAAGGGAAACDDVDHDEGDEGRNEVRQQVGARGLLGRGGGHRQRQHHPAGLGHGRPRQQPHRVVLDEGDEVADGHGHRRHDAHDDQDRRGSFGPGGCERAQDDEQGGQGCDLRRGCEERGDGLGAAGVSLRGPDVERHERQLEADPCEEEDQAEQQHGPALGVRERRRRGRAGEDGLPRGEQPQRRTEDDEGEGHQRGGQQGQGSTPGVRGGPQCDQRDRGQGRQLEADQPRRQVVRCGDTGRPGGCGEHERHQDRRAAAQRLTTTIGVVGGGGVGGVITLTHSARPREQQDDQGGQQAAELQGTGHRTGFVEARAVGRGQAQ